MTNQKSSRLTVAILLVAAVMLLAGGGLTASNMGFKANLALVRASGTGAIGHNWLALPFTSPYQNAAGLCTMTGLPNLATTIFEQNAATGAATTVTCGTAGALSLTTKAGLGWRIRSTSTALPASIIVVGAHAPGTAITIPATSTTNGNIGNFQFAVPYHTTAVTGQDLCTQAGFANLRGTIQRVNATTGAATTATCGTAGASALVLQLGQAVRMRSGDTTRSFTFVPAHF
jgi:hypothetical protein